MEAEIGSDDEMSVIRENPSDVRIITEQFIERNLGLYIQKGDKEIDQEKYWPKRVKLKLWEK